MEELSAVHPLLGQEETMDGGNLSNCGGAPDFQHTLYAWTYTAIFIPGLLTNAMALWVLRGFISKKNKAIIFMINLACADLAHVLSLPLRIFYYVNHAWPFRHFLCLLCFYLKYLNMYASIVFLTLISVQRYVFTSNPFKAKDWKRRYDVAVSVGVWAVAGTACLAFPLSRSAGMKNSTTSCFADLGNSRMDAPTAVGVLVVAELSGFIVPLAVIAYSTLKTRARLKLDALHCANRKEKARALWMIVACACVFVVCFAPYHITFIFYVLVSSRVIQNCAVRRVALTSHPISICLASINCCLNPLLYYFTASEFQSEAVRRGSSLIRVRLMSRESACSV